MEELPNINDVRQDMIKMWAKVMSLNEEVNQANNIMMQMYQTECQYSQNKLSELMKEAEDTLSKIGKKELIDIWKETFSKFY